MKNYYEILQVNEKASKEIIDKVYRTLAKMYHPDANPEEKKKWAEEKFKEINEAYEILSDKDKRTKYDKQLETERNKINNDTENVRNMYKKLYDENMYLKRQLQQKAQSNNNVQNMNANSTANNFNNTTSNQNEYNRAEYYKNIEEEAERKIDETVQKAYRDAYTRRMKDYGYKVYHKKTFKEKLKDLEILIITVVILLIVFRILWFIPDFRDYMSQNLLVQFIEKIIESNKVVK